MKTLAMQSDRDEIVRRLRNVCPDSVARWGRMSAHQMVCHLADAMRMASGRRAVTPDISLFKRTLLKWMVLYAPIRWPPGIMTSPEIDQGRGGSAPLDFAADVAQAEALLEAAPVLPTSLEPPPHPYFGDMSRAAWLRWGYLHSDHHLRQFGA